MMCLLQRAMIVSSPLSLKKSTCTCSDVVTMRLKTEAASSHAASRAAPNLPMGPACAGCCNVQCSFQSSSR